MFCQSQQPMSQLFIPFVRWWWDADFSYLRKKCDGDVIAAALLLSRTDSKSLTTEGGLSFYTS